MHAILVTEMRHTFRTFRVDSSIMYKSQESFKFSNLQNTIKHTIIIFCDKHIGQESLETNGFENFSNLFIFPIQNKFENGLI